MSLSTTDVERFMAAQRDEWNELSAGWQAWDPHFEVVLVTTTNNKSASCLLDGYCEDFHSALHVQADVNVVGEWGADGLAMIAPPYQ